MPPKGYKSGAPALPAADSWHFSCVLEQSLTSRSEVDSCRIIYAVQFSPFDADDLFATAAGNTIHVYACLPDGGIELLQAAIDPSLVHDPQSAAGDRQESFYTLTWLLDTNTGHRLIAAGGRGCAIKVFNPTASGGITLERVLYGHGRSINHLETHPEHDELLLSASKDESIRLYNAVSGACIAIFAGPEGHRFDVISLGFHANGNVFCSGGMDNSIKVWELDTPEIVQAIEQSYLCDPEPLRLADAGGASTCAPSAAAPPPCFSASNSSSSSSSPTTAKQRRMEPVMVYKPIFSTLEVHNDYCDSVHYVANFIISKCAGSHQKGDRQITKWAPAPGVPRVPHLEFFPIDPVRIMHDYVGPNRGSSADADAWFMKMGVDSSGSMLALGAQGKVYLWNVDHPTTIAARKLAARATGHQTTGDCAAATGAASAPADTDIDAEMDGEDVIFVDADEQTPNSGRAASSSAAHRWPNGDRSADASALVVATSEVAHPPLPQIKPPKQHVGSSITPASGAGNVHAATAAAKSIAPSALLALPTGATAASPAASKQRPPASSSSSSMAGKSPAQLAALLRKPASATGAAPKGSLFSSGAASSSVAASGVMSSGALRVDTNFGALHNSSIADINNSSKSKASAPAADADSVSLGATKRLSTALDPVEPFRELKGGWGSSKRIMGMVRSVSFSPSSSTLIGVCDDSTVWRWDRGPRARRTGNGDEAASNAQSSRAGSVAGAGDEMEEDNGATDADDEGLAAQVKAALARAAAAATSWISSATGNTQ